MTEQNAPRRYAEDVNLDDQFAGDSLRAPEPETYAAPEHVEYREAPEHVEAPRPAAPPRPAPQDHRRSTGQELPLPVMDEATGVLMVTIEHDGLELSIPADPEDWPIDATLAFEDGKVLSAIRGLLSTKEFNKILGKKYRNKDFGKLYEKLAKAGGFDTSGN